MNYDFLWVYAQEWEEWVVLFLIYQGTSIMLSKMIAPIAPIYTITNSVGGFPFLHSLFSVYYL